MRVAFGVGGICALLAAAGSAAAATPRPAVILSNGQTGWFLPGQLHVGEVIGCRAHGAETDAKVAAPSPAGVASGSDTWSWSRGAPTLSIERRSNGATQVRCGTATSSAALRPSALPYVIGQNGVGLIRGPNRLGRLEQLYGHPSSLRSVRGSCHAVWRSAALVVTLASTCTSASTLVGAVATGARWSSLTGVHIGDSVAQMLWESPSAKRVAPARWQLAAGGTTHHARLVAVARAGAIVSFRLTGA